MTTLTFDDGTTVELNLSGYGLTPAQPSASFEVVMCKRDKAGNKTNVTETVYRGENPAAVEATFLKSLSNKEKQSDVYKLPAPRL